MQTSLLPIDLAQWDDGPGADLFAVPVWSDVRPLRGAAGLLDWRLCGKISASLRDRRFSGEAGEKLLLTSRRLPWRAVLLVGLGASAEFSEHAFGSAIETVLSSGRSLAARSLALALPGRDLDRVPPERALALLLGILREADDAAATGLQALTIVDTPSALKLLAQHAGLARAPRPAKAAVRATPS